MPTVRNSEIPGILEALNELAELEVPVAGALRIRKVIRALREHWQDVAAVQEQIAKECCQLDEKGELVRVQQEDGSVSSPFRDDEAREKYLQRWRELMEEEFAHPWGIEVKHLGKNDVKASILIRLGEFLVDPEEEKEE